MSVNSSFKSSRGPIMLGYLRKKQYELSSFMPSILDAQGIELDGLWQTFDSILDQCYLERATWGLDIWEEEWNLPTSYEDSYETRRSRIKAKIIGGGTFTEQTARDLANAYSQTRNALFLPLHESYAFKTIYDIDDLTSYTGLKFAFEEAKPAHLLHIVELMIDLFNSFHIQASAKVKSRIKLDYASKIIGGSKLRGSYLYLGFSRYEVDDVDELVFNGAWKFDGKLSFSGMNPFGLDFYLDSADQCSLRHIRAGQVIDEEVF